MEYVATIGRAVMAEFVSLSRRAFRKGVDYTLTMKPLRDAAKGVLTRDTSATTETVKKSVEVSRDANTGSWHVRKAS